MGYIIPTFPKSHLYESKKVAEERIADLSRYFDELMKCNFTQACTPLKDFLFSNEVDKSREELYKAEKAQTKGRTSIEIGAPVSKSKYSLIKAWDPTEFPEMKNLLPKMAEGEVCESFRSSFNVIISMSLWSINQKQAGG